jgi:hypothetical protein
VIRPGAGREPGDQFGHRVLHLDPGVHLEEEVLAVLREQTLDRPGRAVADGSGRVDGDLPDPLAELLGHGRGRRLLDELLVAALDRAVALAEVDDGPVGVGEHLDLDVTRILEVPLDVDRGVGEVRLALPTGRLECALDLVPRADDFEALPAAAGGRLDGDRPAQLVAQRGDLVGGRDRLRRTGDDRDARCLHPLARRDLRAHDVDCLGRGADPDEACVLHGARKGRVLGQEPVTGMDRLDSRTPCCVDDPLLHEIALARRSRTEQISLAGSSDVERVAIRLRVDGDGRAPELPQRAEDPDRDLATIGDEHLREAGHDRHIVSVWRRPIS